MSEIKIKTFGIDDKVWIIQRLLNDCIITPVIIDDVKLSWKQISKRVLLVKTVYYFDMPNYSLCADEVFPTKQAATDHAKRLKLKIIQKKS